MSEKSQGIIEANIVSSNDQYSRLNSVKFNKNTRECQYSSRTENLEKNINFLLFKQISIQLLKLLKIIIICQTRLLHICKKVFWSLMRKIFSNANHMKLFIMTFPRIGLHCTLVPVQNREYECGLFHLG